MFDVRARLLRLVSAFKERALAHVRAAGERDLRHVRIGQELELGRRLQEIDRAREQLARPLGKVLVRLVGHVWTGWVSDRCSPYLRYSHHCWAMVSTLLVTQ